MHFPDLTIFKNNIALIEENGETISYTAIIDFINSFAAYINYKRGLICCLCKNNADAIIGYLGALYNECPAILLDASINNNSLSEIISLYKPEYIWGPYSCKSISNYQIGLKYNDYALYTRKLQGVETIPLNPNLAVCLTTSGSTGSPKFVRLSQENIISNANSIIEYLKISEIDRPILSLPMHYSFGMSIINSHIFKGATILLTEKSVVDPGFWKFIREEKASSLSGVPYTFEMLDKLRFFRMSLPHLKTLTQAGGKLNPELVLKFGEYAKTQDKDFFVMYGQTEASPRISYMKTDDVIDHPTSIGKPIPGGKMWLENSFGKKIKEVEEEGELVYSGKNVCLGYATNRYDLSKGDENDGILHTGDLARIDENGFFYITGRIKRFVKLWGKRVSLDSLEEKIKHITQEIACVGDDSKIIIYITDIKKEIEVLNELIDFTQFPSNVFEIKVIDKIPRGSSGKIIYSELNNN